ncbi:esterase family protein [Bacteroides sp. OttesenSCG-928-D19]|nr:esterase family protein [Bacteroides sp. OttesenSCG-928-D19]
MRNIHTLLILLTLCFLGACTEDSLSDLTGKFNIERYAFTKVEGQSTDKLSKGIKQLNMTLVDGEWNQLVLSIGSREWTLQQGVYTLNSVGAPLGANTYTASLKKLPGYSSTIENTITDITTGSLEVSQVGTTYYIVGLLGTADGRQIKCDYKGHIAFEQGEDDPEASGYTAILTTSAVVVYDANWQPVVSPDVTKYTFSLTDPDGNAAGSFDAINVNNAPASALAGTYTIQGSAAQAWLMDNGWVVPDYGMAGGSFYVDDNGVNLYITGGSVTISAVEGIEGDLLYSFSGTGLTTSTAAGVAGTGAFSIKFATLLQSTGTELKDMTIASTVLGKDMKYSVYLPQSYDGAKTYPVLYMLHGAAGNNNDWLASGMINPYASSAAASGTASEMIVVCPDGLNAFYCNGYQDGMQYMTYFFDEFLPFIESTYKIKGTRGSRAIGGLSMGGYGALYYGLLHPEMFCYVYACSPATYVEGTPNLFEMLGQNPSTLPGITIEMGTEDFLAEMAGYFKGALEGSGIAHEYISRPGAHDWTFWRACTPKIIKKVSNIFYE